MIHPADDDSTTPTTNRPTPTTSRPPPPSFPPTTTPTPPRTSSTKATTLSTKLLHQCRLLLAEVDAFLAALAMRLRRHQQQQHLAEMRQLRSNVLSELRTLERLAAAAAAAAETETTATAAAGAAVGKEGSEGDEVVSESERRLLHALRSSNLPFYAAVWTVAKERCRGVVAFGKRFYWDDSDHDHGRRTSTRTETSTKEKQRYEHGQDEEEEEEEEFPTTTKEKLQKRTSKDKRKSVFVDIVADNGEEWVKVSTITENRLLFEMAEKGWERDDDSDDAVISGDEENGIHGRKKRTVLHISDSEEDEDDQIELVKLASDMARAVRAVRVRYRHPRVRFVIPKLVEGNIPEIDDILNEIRSYGVTVECGTHIPDVLNDELDGNRDPNSVTPEDLPLSTLLPNPYEKFTDTLNVDCTLLLALVSDVSHIRHISPSPSHHRAIVRQIELEQEQPLVPTELWPAMVGRHLICTEKAAKRMREIVDIIGTDTEKERTALLMGDLQLDKDDLLRRFQKLSDHDIPSEFLIPIKVINAQPDINAGLQDGRLPPVAHKITEILSDINRSVFLYGWVKGIVTVTSNRTVVKQIESMIEQNRDGDDELEGPQVWVCDTARSLVGKEKNRKP
ncbi:hypothetical protein VTN77DRAFT_3779 [Rasamsonia byssochlamydoides]|uniref:uncharacterized protein n=1 Tax=Rasamsonia byssochlamydoides TaxID=89139 RepID=UPI0037445D1E